ncbi:hypothetical protein LJC45_03140 [Alistipes sp. OttesenSCG-928-B03]|nr:hypothetical protein [Alistipes sp. OttesenSCG-928-B03]
MMIWNRIIGWFRDLSERDKLIRDFNNSARTSFVGLSVSTLLEARTSKGDASYKHEFSKFAFMSGFRIKAGAGRPLTREEMLYIGRVILNNPQLVRRLYILGWDTLEIEDMAGRKGVKWAIKDFANIGLMIGRDELV